MKRTVTFLLILCFTLFCLNCLPVMVGGVAMLNKSGKTKHEQQEFLSNFYQINLERAKSNLPLLDLCIAKYQFNKKWGLKSGGCKSKIYAYIRGKIDEFGQEIENRGK